MSIVEKFAPIFWSTLSLHERAIWQLMLKEVKAPSFCFKGTPMELLRKHKVKTHPKYLVEWETILQEYIDFCLYVFGSSDIRQSIEMCDEETLCTALLEAKRSRVSGTTIIRKVDNIETCTPLIESIRTCKVEDTTEVIPAYNFLRSIPGLGKKEDELVIYDCIIAELFPECFCDIPKEVVSMAVPNILRSLDQKHAMRLKPFQLTKHIHNFLDLLHFVKLNEALQIKKAKKDGLSKKIFDAGIKSQHDLSTLCKQNEEKEKELIPSIHTQTTNSCGDESEALLGLVLASVEDELTNLKYSLHQTQTQIEAESSSHAKDMREAKKQLELEKKRSRSALDQFSEEKQTLEVMITSLKGDLEAAEELLMESASVSKEELEISEKYLILEVPEATIKEFRLHAPHLMSLILND